MVALNSPDYYRIEDQLRTQLPSHSGTVAVFMQSVNRILSLFLLLALCGVALDAMAQPNTHNASIVIDTANCTCFQQNGPIIKPAHTLSHITSYSAFSKATRLRFVDGENVYNKIRVADLQHYTDRSEGHYAANLIAADPLWITDADSRLSICLNPCTDQKSEIPISVRHRHDLPKQHGWEHFDVDAFDSTTAEYAAVIRMMHTLSHEELLYRMLVAQSGMAGPVSGFDLQPQSAPLRELAAKMADSLWQNSIDIDTYLDTAFVLQSWDVHHITQAEFARLQILYSPRSRDESNGVQIENLSLEQLNNFIHPNYQSRIAVEWVGVELNPDLLCKQKTAVDALVFGSKNEPARMLARVDGMVHNSYHGWQQANVPVLHEPLTMGTSGLHIQIDSADFYLEGQFRAQRPKPSDSPFNSSGPSGSSIHAWADLHFEMLTAVVRDGATRDSNNRYRDEDFYYTSDTVHLGTGRLHFNSHELYGVIWLHDYRDSPADGIIRGTFSLDGQRQYFDKLLFRSAIEAQGGMVHYEIIGGDLVVRWWVGVE